MDAARARAYLAPMDRDAPPDLPPRTGASPDPARGPDRPGDPAPAPDPAGAPAPGPAGDPAPAPEILVDARFLLCPLPVLRLRKALGRAAPGAVLRLHATDPAAVLDVPHFCAEQGHTLLGQQDLTCGATEYRVRKAP